jgi:Sec-independent protein translocase protein TatA
VLWILLLDIVLAVVAVIVLVLVGLGLYRRLRGLGRALSASATRLGNASADLNTAPERARSPR